MVQTVAGMVPEELEVSSHEQGTGYLRGSQRVEPPGYLGIAETGGASSKEKKHFEKYLGGDLEEMPQRHIGGSLSSAEDPHTEKRVA